ncbi:MAG: hypothetical protein Q7S03_03630 [bacterium]|nr:hypothetical protein [bacterium]
MCRNKDVLFFLLPVLVDCHKVSDTTSHPTLYFDNDAPEALCAFRAKFKVRLIDYR